MHGGRVLEARDHVAHLAHAQLGQRRLQRALAAHVVAQEDVVPGHHLQAVARPDGAVEDAHRGHHAAVGVEVRVEDEGLERGVGIARGRRHQIDDGLEQVVDALARLAAHAHGVVGGDGQVLLDLLAHALGLGRGQVDLVDGRHDVEVGVHGQSSALETVWASTPWVASTTSTAPSHAASERETS